MKTCNIIIHLAAFIVCPVVSLIAFGWFGLFGWLCILFFTLVVAYLVNESRK